MKIILLLTAIVALYSCDHAFEEIQEKYIEPLPIHKKAKEKERPVPTQAAPQTTQELPFKTQPLQANENDK